MTNAIKPDCVTSAKQPLRVLMLEDTPRDAKLMVAQFERAGCPIQFELVDLPEAFEKHLEAGGCDVVLADYNLRDWTALDALKILRQSGKDIPLIVVTGSLGDEAAAECIKQGAADFVLKDRTARLPAAIERALEEKRLRAENLRVSEVAARLATIVESSDDAIISKTLEGVITTWNQGAEKLYGYSAAEVMGQPISILAPPDRQEEMTQIITRLTRGERVETYESVRVRKDGSRLDVSVSVFPLANSRGEMIGAASIARDVTERKRGEEERARLMTAIEQSAEAVVITNPAGKIEYVNPAFAQITGYSREEALGQNSRILKSGKQEPEFYEHLWATIRKGQTWHGELVNRRKDGSFYTEQMDITPVRNPLGEVTHFIAAKKDVTERRQLEQQLIQAQKMEAVGRLAGGVAHDFNNLLTIINGYATLVSNRTSKEDPRREHLKEILTAGERAAALTRQLLAFSRRQVMEVRVLNLNSVLADLEKMLRRLIGEDVELVATLQPDLGRVKIDPGQLEQVIMNLVVNARDAMPGGGKLLIETANVEVDENYGRIHSNMTPGRYVMVTASDNGCGMDRETQSHLFEPFFTTKEKGRGTGLGLATVYGIVKQSGGFIWVYSELGRGSTFKVYLPKVEEEASVAKPVNTRPTMTKGSETILVVEDEDGVRSLVCQTLTASGYKVLEAAGAAEALKIAEQLEETIHLLLTDVVMPQTSGKELATRLIAQRPETEVVYMSGYTDDAILRLGILEAGIPFLQKPFSPTVLLLKVKEVLKRNAGRK